MLKYADLSASSDGNTDTAVRLIDVISINDTINAGRVIIEGHREEKNTIFLAMQ